MINPMVAHRRIDSFWDSCPLPAPPSVMLNNVNMTEGGYFERFLYPLALSPGCLMPLAAYSSYLIAVPLAVTMSMLPLTDS